MPTGKGLLNQMLLVLLVLPAISLAEDTYDPVTEVLHLPYVTVGDFTYEVYMEHLGDMVFKVSSAAPATPSDETSDTFDASTGTLIMPKVTVIDVAFSVEMVHQGDLVFGLVGASIIEEEEEEEEPTLAASALGLSDTVWFSSCFIVAGGNPETGDNAYEQFEFHFDSTASTYQLIARIHELEDDDCVGTPAFTIEAEFNLLVGKQFTTTGGAEAYEMDSELTYESVDGVWRDYELDIIRRKNNLLFFGLTAEDTPDDERPDTLNLNFPFRLQD